jgi:hypothetical protein
VEYRDITPELSQIAESYMLGKTPDWLVFFQNLLSEAIGFLRELISRIQFSVPDFQDKASIQLQAVLALLVIAFLLALVAAYFLRLKDQLSAQNLEEAGADKIQPVVSARNWKKKGAALVQSGQFEQAVRAFYFSALHHFDEQKMVAISLEKTNFEYYASLRNYPVIQEIFSKLAFLQEGVTYGGKPADEKAASACLDHLNRIEEELSKLTAKDRLGA